MITPNSTNKKKANKRKTITAIILAAGEGKRARHLVGTTPKSVYPLPLKETLLPEFKQLKKAEQNFSTLELLLLHLPLSRIERIVIVGGYNFPILKRRLESIVERNFQIIASYSNQWNVLGPESHELSIVLIDATPYWKNGPLYSFLTAVSYLREVIPKNPTTMEHILITLSADTLFSPFLMHEIARWMDFFGNYGLDVPALITIPLKYYVKQISGKKIYLGSISRVVKIEPHHIEKKEGTFNPNAWPGGLERIKRGKEIMPVDFLKGLEAQIEGSTGTISNGDEEFSNLQGILPFLFIPSRLGFQILEIYGTEQGGTDPGKQGPRTLFEALVKNWKNNDILSAEYNPTEEIRCDIPIFQDFDTPEDIAILLKIAEFLLRDGCT